MSKVEEKKQHIITAVTQHLIATGLSDVGLRKLAAVSDTSDRMLIYYFGTKDDLLHEVMLAIAAGLSAQLDAVLGTHRRDSQTLAEELIALGDVPQFRSIVQLWFEVVGLAARGQPPYAESAFAIGNNWLAWLADKLVKDEAKNSNELAQAIFAKVEGHLLLKLIGLDQPQE